jgi:Type II secretion system (T2SS), protein M subtype b
VTGRDRRAILGGAFVVVLAVLFLRVAPWAWREVSDARSELQGKAARLSFMQGQLSRARALEDSGEVVRAGIARLAPALLSASSTGEAAAGLTSLINVAAELSRARVRRTDMLTDSVAAGLARRVSVRASLDADTRALFGLLGRLARGPELMSVEGIQVAGEPVADPNRPELLHAEITVSGWYLPTARRK